MLVCGGVVIDLLEFVFWRFSYFINRTIVWSIKKVEFKKELIEMNLALWKFQRIKL
jgi:hypothetical protein